MQNKSMISGYARVSPPLTAPPLRRVRPRC
jgi:hypothetical protein